MATPNTSVRSNCPSIIISGLHSDVTDDMIFQHFEKLDRNIKLKSVIILRDKTTGESFGTGKIKFFNKYDGNIIIFFIK